MPRSRETDALWRSSSARATARPSSRVRPGARAVGAEGGGEPGSPGDLGFCPRGSATCGVGPARLCFETSVLSGLPVGLSPTRAQVVFDANAAIVAIDPRPRTRLAPDPRAGYKLRASLSLPFRGEWWVFWGGRTEQQNYHVIAPDQRRPTTSSSGATAQRIADREPATPTTGPGGNPSSHPPTVWSWRLWKAFGTTGRRSNSRTAGHPPATTSSSISAWASTCCSLTCNAGASWYAPAIACDGERSSGSRELGQLVRAASPLPPAGSEASLR